jgi:hypothetical protein
MPPKRQAATHRKGADNPQDMIDTTVTLKLTDGSHIVEEVSGTLAGVCEFGVTLHKKYRSQMRIMFYPWHSVFHIIPEPLKAQAQHNDED